MNKIKIDNYYKPESKTLRLDEIDYTIIPNSDIKTLLDKLQQENKHLKEQLLVTQTNEETFRLEMKDITKILGLAEDTLFDDVKVYARNLKDNWNKLKEYLHNVDVVVDYSENYDGRFINYDELIDKMQELEKAESDE